MWTEAIFASFITLFVVIDPIGLVPLFLALTPNATKSQRRIIAGRAVFVGFVILLAFGLLGDELLRFLGISLAAFRMAGGLLLFVIALEMLFEKHHERRERNVTDQADAEAEALPQDDLDDVSVFPLGIPLIAGPGAITSIILLMNEQQGSLSAQSMVMGVMVGIMLLTLVLFLIAGAVSHYISPMVTRAVTRVLSVILAALALQFILDGVREFALLL
ncbi:multiple antibiotic resistance protein [Rhodoligotrophos appendicifer]|uniref:MarC family protein n=1 Tax=Rhodoligotrophos appendicifer TaxID=987056 RepID=UPI0011846D1E|nr:MarC family protein [Rhodoligotrophos appendicifer]